MEKVGLVQLCISVIEQLIAYYIYIFIKTMLLENLRKSNSKMLKVCLQNGKNFATFLFK